MSFQQNRLFIALLRIGCTEEKSLGENGENEPGFSFTQRSSSSKLLQNEFCDLEKEIAVEERDANLGNPTSDLQWVPNIPVVQARQWAIDCRKSSLGLQSRRLTN